MSQVGAVGESEFAALARALTQFRAVRLQGEPSDRALAKAARVSPQTVGDWLRGVRFPQDVGKVVAVVRAIAAVAADHGITEAAGAGGLLDEARWRNTHGAELQRRADVTSVAVRRAQALSALAGPASGRLLEQVTDPFALEVHRPVQADGPPGGLPVLPAYLPRDHDLELGQVVQAGAEGRSGIAVLVGGSSTGKTRACWEALQSLRDRPEGWRVWHPIDPSRPDAALRGLPSIGPQTVVWLNEAQFYLDVPEGGLGERVAAGLREALRDPGRAPVLVLATMWPQFWNTITRQPLAGTDSHAHARELIGGHDIAVPDAFPPVLLEELRRAVDPRLTAAALAEDGQVTQFLAGAPELLSRYRNAQPTARALLHAAIDARRLGVGLELPRAFLEAAAPGYLTALQHDDLQEGWLDQALADTAAPAKGARGPLTRVRPQPARQIQAATTPVGNALSSSGPTYRLADYLEQAGRLARCEQMPPATFWAAAAAHAHPGELGSLGDAAYDRGLYRDAAQLRKHAAGHGDAAAARRLVEMLHLLHPADQRAAQWAARHAVFDDSYEARDLLNTLVWADGAGLAATLAGPAADHAALSNPYAIASLLHVLGRVGGAGPVTALARRAATSVALDHPDTAIHLLRALEEMGVVDQAAAFARRIVDWAASIACQDPRAVSEWLTAVRRVGGLKQAAELAQRAVPDVSLADPYAIARLLETLLAADAPEQVSVLAGRAAACVPLGDARAAAALVHQLRQLNEEDHLVVLAGRVAAEAPVNEPEACAVLMRALYDAGAREQASVLLARRPGAHARLDSPLAVAQLLRAMRAAGGQEQVRVLARRAAADSPLQDPDAVVGLLRELGEADCGDQVTVLLARDLAGDADLGDPSAVARLLGQLAYLGAAKQATALLRRDPAGHAAVDSPDSVATLLYTLADAGDVGQFSALADRAADHIRLRYYDGLIDLMLALRSLGAEKQFTRLAERIAECVPLDGYDDEGLEKLVMALRGMGAGKKAYVLVDRMPGAGLFDDFLMLSGLRERFRYGRDPNGQPAGLWDWDDLY